MKTIFKDFFFVLKRFKAVSLLNILGLTAAFIGFVLISIQINYELGFDKHFPKHEDIYRARYKMTNPKDPSESYISTSFVRNTLDLVIENGPKVEKGTLIYPYVGGQDFKPTYVQVDKQGSRQGFKEVLVTCYPDIVDIFDFQMVEGTKDCLTKPEAAVIPESMAKRLFGSEPALGKILHYNQWIQSKAPHGTNTLDLVVGGVYKDFPKNVQLGNHIYSAIDKDYAKTPNDQSSNHMFYILVEKGADIKQIENLFVNNPSLLHPDHPKMELFLDKISDVYYSKENNGDYKTGDSSTATMLIAIAILVIVVAAINFTNFSIALSSSRLKSINIRKVLGSTDASLRKGLVLEAVFISILALLLALTVVYFIVKENWMPFIETDISQSNYILIVTIAFLVAILTGIVAGIRPAFYMTSFAPSEALKGKVIFSSSGFKMRSLLVGFQFLVAIALVSITALMYKQHVFMRDYKLGFDTDQIAVVDLPNDIASRVEYAAGLKSHPSIVDVAFSAQKLGASDSFIRYGGMRLNGEGENIGYVLFPVSWNFLDVMNINPIEGRKFTEEDAKSSETSLIISKKTKDQTKAEIGDSFSYSWRLDVPQRVIGIVDNIQFTSLRNEVGSMAFTLNDKNGHHRLPVSYIKIAAGANIRDVVAHINKTIASIDAAYPAKIEFYDELFDELYKSENKLSNSVSTFSLLAIIIAIMGVFGLVMFEGASRRKEVALRKVLGSTITQILSLFNKSYIKIFCISLVLAIPLVYYAINKWLEQFAYKANLGWWDFLIGGGIILIVVILTVSIQSYRTAIANPIESLKDE